MANNPKNVSINIPKTFENSFWSHHSSIIQHFLSIYVVNKKKQVNIHCRWY